MENRNQASLQSALLDPTGFKPVSELSESSVPDRPGLYAIRIQQPESLPEVYASELQARNETLLYIGQASVSLRKRLWEEELHASRHATFFRSIGAMLGYLPASGSLFDRKNKNNYKFIPADQARIIDWMAQSLSVRYIEVDSDLDSLEGELIKTHCPLINLLGNPRPFAPLQEARRHCKEVANEEP